jgi:hypothetical protein
LEKKRKKERGKKGRKEGRKKKRKEERKRRCEIYWMGGAGRKRSLRRRRNRE